MTGIQQTKQVIYGDGADTALVIIDGQAGAAVTYSINGTPFEDVFDAGGLVQLPITCDTPNLSIVVECDGQRVTIYSVGAP